MEKNYGETLARTGKLGMKSGMTVPVEGLLKKLEGKKMILDVKGDYLHAAYMGLSFPVHTYTVPNVVVARAGEERWLKRCAQKELWARMIPAGREACVSEVEMSFRFASNESLFRLVGFDHAKWLLLDEFGSINRR